jgi:Protein of unknown function (DUF616)
MARLRSALRKALTLTAMKRTAIYTAIFGGHDDLHEQPACPGVDYFCFTDDPSLSAEPWQVVDDAPRYDHPRLSAKWFRMHPHEALSDYRHTIWIDGNFRLKSESFASEVLSYLDDRGFAIPMHPHRDNLIDEAVVSLEMDKYKDAPIIEQIEHYRSEGFDPGHGLWMTGLLARDNENDLIRTMNEMWMEENLRWTYQDQISLPYVLWKLDITPALIPFSGTLRNNNLFLIDFHRTSTGI